MTVAAQKTRFTFIAVALLAVTFAGCSVQVDVDGGRCDDTHPCPSGWRCGADGWCGQTEVTGGGTDGGTEGDTDGGTDGGGETVDPLALGAPCTSGSQCDSGFCVDRVCCDRGCTEACVACNRSGKEGTCTHAAVRTDPENDCGNYYCGSSGGCASSCEDDRECKLGSCESIGGSRRACE